MPTRHLGAVKGYALNTKNNKFIKHTLIILIKMSGWSPGVCRSSDEKQKAEKDKKGLAKHQTQRISIPWRNSHTLKKELRHPYLDRHDDVNKNEQQQQIVGKRRPNKSMDIHRGCHQRPKGGPR